LHCSEAVRNYLHGVLATILLCGCGVGAKQRIIATAIDGDSARAEYLEASLRVFDEHPEYVDELFRLARRHPAAMDRFVASAVADLDERRLAELTAGYLARNPPALEEILIRTLDAAEDRPAARAAIGRAIAARRSIAAGIITDDARGAESTLLATVDLLADKPAARRAFLRVMEARAPELAALIAANPPALRAMMRAVFSAGLGVPPELLRQVLDLPP
jgi:hypothetical protein